MKKIPLINLDLTVFYEKLENGLDIYVVPKEQVNNIYATFTTKFGSKTNEFIPLGEKKMIRVPDGVAHFLEHKLFEQIDGTDPFAFYSERGADCNANTSKEKTTYLFSGTDFLEENLNYLLDYVQSPYFTDENVEKEKGIIEQEIRMYDDQPFWVMYDHALFNSFFEDPIRIPIAGTVESIWKITKEDLVRCYETFYHPSNMFVVVTGNVDPDEIIRIVKENQAKKEFAKETPIKTKTYQEKESVSKKKETVKMDVAIPKFVVNYKFDYKKSNFDLREFTNYLSIYTDSTIGITSLFAEKLKEEELITEDFGLDMNVTDQYLILSILGESKDPEKVIAKLDQELKKEKVEEADFERKKKMMKSSSIYMSDNIFSINNKIMNNIVRYNRIIDDLYKDIESLTLKDLKRFLKEISFDLSNQVIVLPKHGQ